MLQLLKKTVFLILAAISVAACSSSDPEYVDPEAHEKTIQLNEKYGPVLVGTWHFEKIGEKQLVLCWWELGTSRRLARNNAISSD